MIGIYAIRCLANNRMYVGRSTQLGGRRDRFFNHLYRLRRQSHWSQELQRDFDRYGIEQFSFEILEECSKDDLVELEKEYLTEFEDQLYNVRRSTWNAHMSESAKVRKPYSDEERQKRIDRLNANRQSPEEHSKSVRDAWMRRKGSKHRGS